MTRMNGQWRLRSRPEGMISEANFEFIEEPLRELEEGETLIRNLYLAFEPAMRGWVNDEPSYLPPVRIGAVMRSSSVGQIVESKHPDHPVGQLVSGMLGWQQYALVPRDPGPRAATSGVARGVGVADRPCCWASSPPPPRHGTPARARAASARAADVIHSARRARRSMAGAPKGVRDRLYAIDPAN